MESLECLFLRDLCLTVRVSLSVLSLFTLKLLEGRHHLSDSFSSLFLEIDGLTTCRVMLNFNWQRVQNEQRLSGLGVLSVVQLGELGSHHAMAWDQLLVRERDRFDNGKHTGQEASVLVYHHWGCHWACLGLVSLPIKQGHLDKRVTRAASVTVMVILTVVQLWHKSPTVPLLISVILGRWLRLWASLLSSIISG